MIRKFFSLPLMLIVILCGFGPGWSQTKRATNGGLRIERAGSRPDLAVAFDEVAQLKIVARKTNYRIGEMITLDIALLNTSSQELFFRRLSEVQVKVQNSAGKTLTVQAYGVSDRALVPSSFIRLAANEMMVRSFQLLVGCDKRAFAQSMSEHDNSTLFKKDLFLSWGDACLPIDQKETLTISTGIKNSFTVFSTARGKDKTAVGTVNSNSLELRIDDKY